MGYGTQSGLDGTRSTKAALRIGFPFLFLFFGFLRSISDWLPPFLARSISEQ